MLGATVQRNQRAQTRPTMQMPLRLADYPQIEAILRETMMPEACDAANERRIGADGQVTGWASPGG